MANIQPLFCKSEENPTQSTLSKPLIEFRAGKMNMASGSKLVVPDERKGMVQIRKSEDRLVHFIWKDRTNNKIEDDLIIFPDDIEFSRVSKCKTGRVYVMKFKSSPRRMFFWMQEPSDKKDKYFCNKVNQYLNKLPVTESDSKEESDTSTSAEDLSETNDIPLSSEDISSLLSNLNPEELTQLATSGIIGNPSGSMIEIPVGNLSRLINPAAATQNSEVTRESKRPAEAVQLPDLKSILSSIKVPKTESTPPINLVKGLNPDVIGLLIKNSKFLDAAKNCLPPFNGDIANEVRSTISSPQFQQAMALFSSGIQSGQLAPVIQQFNLGGSAIAAATAGDMEAFIKALQENDKGKEDEGNDVDMEQ